MRSRADRVPDWLLERLAAGELPANRAAELRAVLAAQGEEHRLVALAESNAQMLAAMPAEQAVAEIKRRAAARQAPVQRHRSVFAFSLAAACAAGLAVFLVARTPEPTVVLVPKVGSDADTRLKGLKPSLRVYRQTNGGDEALAAGTLVRKGDSLHVRYVAAGKRFGVIASIDARGEVTLHLPEASGPAAALIPDGERALPHSYELDDSPGFERFVFVTSDRSFATAEVASALKRGSSLPAALNLFELTFKKEAP